MLRGGPNVTLEAQYLCLWESDVCEKGGEKIRPNYALEENMNNLILTYTPGVCVFPARSGFNPGWDYVHVGGDVACLISPKLGSCIIGLLLCLLLH